MRRVGAVVRTAQGLAVVRCEDETVPEIGTALVDEDLTAVGEVVAVFGPVERPYLAVDPDPSVAVATTLGQTVYAR